MLTDPFPFLRPGQLLRRSNLGEFRITEGWSASDEETWITIASRNSAGGFHYWPEIDGLPHAQICLILAALQGEK